jgi:hypothetical protein
MAKPLAEKLNAGWQAAVKRMLATRRGIPDQPNAPVSQILTLAGLV